MRFAVFVVLLGLAACATTVPENTPEITSPATHSKSLSLSKRSDPDIQGIHFVCKSGLQFTISFLKDDKKAYLVLSDSNDVQVLDNENLGTGTAYSNKHYSYEEHADDITLTHPVANKIRMTSCREQSRIISKQK